ncbi:MAG: ATP-binding protein [Phycisphaeraceae bacterium]|nr:ATP-binding protein [Phycisphaeraceae bacterium]MCW5753279.1 ATP-binding protein [Phycisphaeraceae bacterium]
MSDRPHVRIEMLSDPLYLSGARELVSAVARRLGFDEPTCSQIALAVDEALANVICHGYQRRPDGLMWISLWPLALSPDTPSLRIVIEDEARQIDCEQIRGRDLDDIRPGGLGVHIIRQIMDHVLYEKRSPCGMRLTLVKTGPVRPPTRENHGHDQETTSNA